MINPIYIAPTVLTVALLMIGGKVIADKLKSLVEEQDEPKTGINVVDLRIPKGVEIQPPTADNADLFTQCLSAIQKGDPSLDERDLELLLAQLRATKPKRVNLQFETENAEVENVIPYSPNMFEPQEELAVNN